MNNGPINFSEIFDSEDLTNDIENAQEDLERAKEIKEKIEQQDEADDEFISVELIEEFQDILSNISDSE